MKNTGRKTADRVRSALCIAALLALIAQLGAAGAHDYRRASFWAAWFWGGSPWAAGAIWAKTNVSEAAKIRTRSLFLGDGFFI